MLWQGKYKAIDVYPRVWLRKFGFIGIEGETIEAEPGVQSEQTRFKAHDGGVSGCSFKTDVELSIISVFL